MEQKEKPKKRQKRKPKEKLEFNAGMVFGVEPASEVTLESLQDLLRFRAQKGQGGDRRHGGPAKPNTTLPYPLTIPWRVGQPIR